MVSDARGSFLTASAINHDDTVALMVKLMEERGIPVVFKAFNGGRPRVPVIADPAANVSRQFDFSQCPCCEAVAGSSRRLPDVRPSRNQSSKT
jgi:hypothetical protein